MEAIEKIKSEFKPSIKDKIEIIPVDSWNVTTAEATAPGTPDPVILTAAIIKDHFQGRELPELTAAVESLTEFYICDYFHYNNFLLVDSDIKVYLTSYYRQDNWKDNLLIETNPEYNVLYNELPADAEYYFKVSEDYNPYIFNVEEEALDFLTWTILNDNLNGSDWKDTITDKDIINAIAAQSQDHQEIIRTANYKELLDDIRITYNKIIKDYLQESQDSLYNVFYDEIYFTNQDAATHEIIREYIGQPIKNII